MMNKKLLIVDDQDDLRRMLRITLGYGIYVMFDARNGSEALEIFEREQPDVVLLDVTMPGEMNGFEVCRLIKKIITERQLSSYVALLTARETPEDIEAGKNAAADIYIVKPFSPMKLVEIIESRHLSDSPMKVVRPHDR